MSRPTDRPASPITRLALAEVYLSWRFVWRDLSATMVPAFIFMLAAARSRWPLSATELLLAVALNVLYYWLYIYSFCLANQITGVDEDRINKPDRPLPARLVTLRGAYVRYVLTTTGFALVGWHGEVLSWTLLWIATTFLLTFGRLDRHWVTKNVCAMSAGTLAQLGAAWEMVTPMTPASWKWIAVVAAFVGATTPFQDFRDLEGDRRRGRRTLPVVLGQARARVVMAAVFLTMPIVIHMSLIAPLVSWGGLACDLAFAIMSTVIAVRILRGRDTVEDHRTYMLHTYQYCALLAGAIVLLGR